MLFISNNINSQVFVNQAGYLTNKTKLVYLSSSADSFYVHNILDSSIVYKNETELWKENDPSTGLTIYRGDFTDFIQNGEFYITDNLENKSYPFEISDTVFNSVLKKSLKGFYFQRCGVPLLSTNAGVYAHPICHNNDGTFHSTSDSSGHLSATGGWHDAGDYGKYIVNAGISVGTLLKAYELFPKRFEYDDSNIPESGNGIPDILDEIRFELDWFFKMQRSDGGVFFKLTRAQFSGFIMPQLDNATRYIYQVSSTATADFAAVMAGAYRSFKNYDTEYSDKCLDAAKKAWEFLEANPSIVPLGGFKNPTGTVTGEYGDGNDSDERLWAATELYISTGEDTYKNYFDLNYHSQIFTSEMSWPNVRSMAYLTYLMSDADYASESIKNQLMQSLITYCDGLLNNKINNDGFNVSINSYEYYWGCNSNVLSRAILLIVGYELTHNNNYYDAALSQMNYVLGANAHNLSFVTGIGAHHVMNPHRRPSFADGIKEPVPGLLAGGPNKGLDDPTLKSLFDSSTPAALCYVDNTDSYASNEIAINWNAPLVFVSGYFNNGNYPVSVPKRTNKPRYGFLLNQNFPNPFNPTTTINYTIPDNTYKFSELQHVTLKVYDLLGEEISSLVDDYKLPGVYKVTFNTSKIASGKRGLASGIYFYTLHVGDFFVTKKMQLIK